VVEDFRRVAILGLGLIGGSLALALQARNIAVSGYAHREQTANLAREAGIPATTSLPDAVADADLVILAVPLRAMADTAIELARHIGATDDATVMDVGSVKGPVREAIEAAGLGERFVGAHPMAGNEYSGFAAATNTLMLNAPWAVTTRHSARAERVAEPRANRIIHFIETVLDGNVTVLTDAAHDEAAALISHVPHVVATQLLNAVAQSPLRDEALALAAGSFRDGTRVAHTDPARTEAMVAENAAHVAPALRRAAADLAALAAALETGASTTTFFHTADSLRMS